MADILDLTCGHGSCEHAGSYTLPGHCNNCAHTFTLKITKGHEAPGAWLGARCPNCGCSRVQASLLAMALNEEDTSR